MPKKLETRRSIRPTHSVVRWLSIVVCCLIAAGCFKLPSTDIPPQPDIPPLLDVVQPLPDLNQPQPDTNQSSDLGPVVEHGFESDSPQSGPRLELGLGASTTTFVTVQIKAYEMNAVLGLAFQLTWDPKVLSLDAANSSATFSLEGTESVFLVKEAKPGRALAGTALFRQSSDTPISGVNLNGGQSVIQLRFSILSPGKTTMRFVVGRERVRRVDGAEIRIKQIGGTITVLP